MIRLLYDTTVDGIRHGKGAILALDPPIETSLMAQGNADRNIDFSAMRSLPALVGQSYAPASRTSLNGAGDASYAILTSVILPGGIMGLSSKLVITPDWDNPSSPNIKYFAIDFGGASISAPSVTTTIMAKILIEVQNLNSLSSQKTMNGSSYGVSNNARLSSAVDTSQNVSIDFKVKWGAPTTTQETLTLLGYSIWHYPGS